MLQYRHNTAVARFIKGRLSRAAFFLYARRASRASERNGQAGGDLPVVIVTGQLLADSQVQVIKNAA